MKASPHPSARYGETVCCAGVTPELKWVRIYPIQFRHLGDAQRFSRWDWIQYSWKKPRDDARIESRRVSHDKIAIVDQLARQKRADFLAPLVRTSLDHEIIQGNTLALIRPRQVQFSYARKTSKEMEDEAAELRRMAQQLDMLTANSLVPREPCPYRFHFKYLIDDGPRTATCGDWETEATFFNLKNRYSEEVALKHLESEFGERYPIEGMAFAMGTHSRFPKTWLLVGVIRLDEPAQLSLL